MYVLFIGVLFIYADFCLPSSSLVASFPMSVDVDKGDFVNSWCGICPSLFVFGNYHPGFSPSPPSNRYHHKLIFEARNGVRRCRVDILLKPCHKSSKNLGVIKEAKIQKKKIICSILLLALKSCMSEQSHSLGRKLSKAFEYGVTGGEKWLLGCISCLRQH